MAEAFQVDLRGVVELLSHHLYSGPRVYVRELLQNAADAITVRRELDPDAPRRVTFVPADVATDGRLHVVDTGVGLTPQEVRAFLTTIGASSKRDELGLRRDDMIGQFGIGLLAAFLVTDEVELVTRSVHGGPAVRWLGRSDGSFDLSEVDVEEADPDGWLYGEAGTHVALAPRRGEERLLATGTVTELLGSYGALLPIDVQVGDGAGGSTKATAGVTPWGHDVGPLARRDRLNRYALDELRAEPFEVLDITVPEADLTGVAVVVDRPTASAAPMDQRVYIRGMLVGDVQGLVPSWAFFVRCAVTSTQLRPTASREALYEDELLETVRESIGAQIRAWLLRLAATDPDRMARFLRNHHLGIKSLATTDDELLRAIVPLLPFETTLGNVTLNTFAATHGVLRYTRTVDEFRQVAAVAAAQGVGVINGGYVHDAALVERWAAIEDDLQAEHLAPGMLDAHVSPVPDARLRALDGFVTTARAVLDRLDVDVELRQFEPNSLPALFLDDRESRHRRDSRSAAANADPLFAALLSDLDPGGAWRPRLLLNDRNPIVQRLAEMEQSSAVPTAVESLYCQALLLGHHPMRPADTAAMSRSFLGLLDLITGTE